MDDQSNAALEATLNRLREIPSNTSEPAAKPQPTAGEIDAALEKRGYPARHRENLSRMAGPGFKKAQGLLARVIDRNALLILIGDHGPGKTQMATWWASERLKAGNSAGLYVKTADLLGEIKQTWNDGGKSIGTESDILRRYKTAKYLVLDEFHERGAGPWDSRTLNNILDHRYDAMLVTIIIANLSLADFKTQISASIRSRAEETGGLIVCDWPSYRQAA